MKMTLRQVQLYLSETDKQGNRVGNDRASIALAQMEAEQRATVNKNMQASLAQLGLM